MVLWLYKIIINIRGNRLRYTGSLCTMFITTVKFFQNLKKKKKKAPETSQGHFSDPALHITHSRKSSAAVQMFLNNWLSEEKGLGSQTFLISVVLRLLRQLT